jgi:hypothetical protein
MGPYPKGMGVMDIGCQEGYSNFWPIITTMLQIIEDGSNNWPKV